MSFVNGIWNTNVSMENFPNFHLKKCGNYQTLSSQLKIPTKSSQLKRKRAIRILGKRIKRETKKRFDRKGAVLLISLQDEVEDPTAKYKEFSNSEFLVQGNKQYVCRILLIPLEMRNTVQTGNQKANQRTLLKNTIKILLKPTSVKKLKEKSRMKFLLFLKTS